MRTSFELAKRFREVILNGTWIANTNYQQELKDLDWQIATTSIQPLNTIALLAQHIHYYIRGVKQVLEGGSLDIKDKYSFDFPPIQSQLEWKKFLAQFWKDAEDFALLVEPLPEEKLKEAFVNEKYGTFLRNIDGMIEHSYYHLGQIVILKKLLDSNR